MTEPGDFGKDKTTDQCGKGEIVVASLREDMTAAGVADEEGEQSDDDGVEISRHDGGGGNAEEHRNERLGESGVFGRERFNDDEPDRVKGHQNKVYGKEGVASGIG